jgi:prevent-host-death family protein
VNIHEAKTNFSRLIVEVQAGKEVVITRAGQPVAKLVPYDGQGENRRTPGGWEGRVRIAADFDDLPADVLEAFEGPAH